MKYKLIKNTETQKADINGEKKDIPINWEVLNFAKFSSISRGGSPRPIQDFLTENKKEGTPWIKISDATKVSKYIETTEQYILKSGEKRSRLVYPGDLIVSNSATPGIPRFLKITACIHDGWLLLRDFKGVDKEFLFYLIGLVREKLKSHGSGSIFTNLSIDVLSNFECLIPPLEKQSIIASIMSKQESIISNLESLIEKNETIFKHLSNELLSGNIRIKDDNKQLIIYKNIDWKNFEINGSLRNIPIDWSVEKIRDTIQLNMGSTPKKESDNYSGDLPWITISNLTNKYISEYTAKIKRTKNIRVFPKGTLIGSFKMSVGRFGFITDDSAVNEAIMGIKDDGTENNLNYLYYCLPEIFISNAEKNGQGLLLLNQEKIKNLQYLIPPINEQILIANFLAKKEESIAKQKELLAKEKQKFDWLLENLLSGKYLVEEIK